MEFSNIEIFLCCITGIPLLFLGILAIYIDIIRPFSQEREYIKMEMRRSYGLEYRYWKQELRKLYIEHIPILGWFIRRFRR